MGPSKKAGGLMFLKRASSLSHMIVSPFILVLNRFFSLLVPRDWSRATLMRIVNIGAEEEREAMIKVYIESELAKMNTTGVTVQHPDLAPRFSWYNIDNTTWITRSAWYSGLVLSIASVASSAIHTAAFLRLKCETEITQRFRQALGKRQKQNEPWHPHVLTPYVLGGPTLHLKLAVLMFLIGLFCELWRAAVQASLSWHSDDLKIAFIVTLVGGFVVVNYIFSVLTLVHYSIHTD
ncbi:MAG: hypothetical protein LQ344_002668 [Seirophora lacunosa]|nr:MAG: hypothetical protein LQ344_002668 [Seirophora lacunosa]